VTNRHDPPRLLVADDQGDVLEALRLLLKGEGFQVDTASSPAGVLTALGQSDYDALLIDLNYTRDTTSGRDGLDLLDRLRALDPSLPVIVMTAWGSVEGAVDAMRRGARDYLEKPWDNARLTATLRTQVELGRALRHSRRLEEENRLLRRTGTPDMVASSPAMREVLDVIERIGPSDANVLVLGEHGTGKEVTARLLHTVSRRGAGPLVTVNAGALPEGLVESELFGHVKGAFTDARSDRTGCFELADGGTLLLDEIANIPLGQQAKLLRVLETGEVQRIGDSRVRSVDVRFITATNADLEERVAAGAFREDLLYRINTVEIRLPPLRERREDIPELAARFLSRESEHYGKKVTGFSDEALRSLVEHAWPGNVRELEHVVERAVLMSRTGRIEVEDLGLRARGPAAPGFEELTLEDAEQHLIRKALDRFDGNVSRAAEALGISRSALYRRLQRYDL
jgi:DNA-binding NtrC family response regulator